MQPSPPPPRKMCARDQRGATGATSGGRAARERLAFRRRQLRRRLRNASGRHQHSSSTPSARSRIRVPSCLPSSSSRFDGHAASSGGARSRAKRRRRMATDSSEETSRRTVSIVTKYMTEYRAVPCQPVGSRRRDVDDALAQGDGQRYSVVTARGDHGAGAANPTAREHAVRITSARCQRCALRRELQ